MRKNNIGSIGTTLGLSMVLVLTAASSAAAQAQTKDLTSCQYGWLGGVAGNTTPKWVNSLMIADSNGGPSSYTFKYDWKNGVMSGTIQSDGKYTGTWSQSDGSGAFMIDPSDVSPDGTLNGWWGLKSENNKTHYKLFVKNCKTYAEEIKKVCRYGWLGGVAGDKNIMWVDATITSGSSDTYIVKYNHMGGTMTGTVKAGYFQGTWKQSNGSGNFSVRVPNQAGEMRGTWSSAADGNKAQYTLILNRCS